MSAASDGRRGRGADTPDVMRELNAVRAGVRRQLGELLDALDGEGGRYADHYAEWMISRGGHMQAPPAPPALVQAAPMIRELVRDEATSVRLYGVREAA